MAALAEVGREISATLDLEPCSQRIAERAQTLLEADIERGLPRRSRTAQTFRAIAAVGEIAEQILADAITLGEGIIGSLAAEARAEVVNDVNADPRSVHDPGTPRTTSEERLMVAPLLGRQAGDRA